MQIDSGMIIVGVFLVIVGIFSAVEQRRAAKKHAADSTAFNNAVANSQSTSHQLLALQK